MLQPEFADIFASLGSPQTGATFDEVKLRSGLEDKKVKLILAKMESVGVVKYNGTHYIAMTNLLDFDFMETDEYFKRNYLNASQKAIKRLPSAHTQGSLFMTQTFSILSKDMPRLRTELKEFILNFANSAENSEGDQVSEICISFTTSKSS